MLYSQVITSESGSDCQGLAKPLGLEDRVQRVMVRVRISLPLANPYPQQKYRGLNIYS